MPSRVITSLLHKADGTDLVARLVGFERVQSLDQPRREVLAARRQPGALRRGAALGRGQEEAQAVVTDPLTPCMRELGRPTAAAGVRRGRQFGAGHRRRIRQAGALPGARTAIGCSTPSFEDRLAPGVGGPGRAMKLTEVATERLETTSPASRRARSRAACRRWIGIPRRRAAVRRGGRRAEAVPDVPTKARVIATTST